MYDLLPASPYAHTTHARKDICTPADYDSAQLQLNRKTIDILKEYFRDEMTKDDWRLIMRMKKLYNII